MATKSCPVEMVEVTNAVARIDPRDDQTMTRSFEAISNASASAAETSTHGVWGDMVRSIADFDVRVPVCHWLELPRPVSSTQHDRTVFLTRP